MLGVGLYGMRNRRRLSHNVLCFSPGREPRDGNYGSPTPSVGTLSGAGADPTVAPPFVGAVLGTGWVATVARPPRAKLALALENGPGSAAGRPALINTSRRVFDLTVLPVPADYGQEHRARTLIVSGAVLELESVLC